VWLASVRGCAELLSAPTPARANVCVALSRPVEAACTNPEVSDRVGFVKLAVPAGVAHGEGRKTADEDFPRWSGMRG
jgi:hypothetical protein